MGCGTSSAENVVRPHKRVRYQSMTSEVSPNQMPTPDDKVKLDELLSKPRTAKLEIEEQQLLWRHKEYLKDDHRARFFVLHHTDVSRSEEIKQVEEFVMQWERNSLTVDQVLWLLSARFRRCPLARDKAIRCISTLSDKELEMVVFPLLQGLRYEDPAQQCSLFASVQQIASRTPSLANKIHWLLFVERELEQNNVDSDNCDVFTSVYDDFSKNFGTGEHGMEAKKTLDIQVDFFRKLSDAVETVRESNQSNQQKTELMRELVKQEGGAFQCVQDEDYIVPLPLDTTVKLSKIHADKISVFKSALCPILIPFETPNGESRMFIYKKGEDLRQDRLIMEIIQIMDSILQDGGMDLAITPYKIASISSSEGLLECIPSKSLQAVVKMFKHRDDITSYFKQLSPSDNERGYADELYDNFFKSCAAYVVITYILAIGDRHLDNIMLCNDGRMFHIDFSYIFGKDPKPFPPPIKLCKEMINVWGGKNDEQHQVFTDLCGEIYKVLRRESAMVLASLHLLTDAGIPHLDESAFELLEERLCLQMSEEEAVGALKEKINSSIDAFFGRVSDVVHGWVAYWK